MSPNMQAPFTQADKIQMARLQQAQSQCTQAVNDGELEPDEADELMQMVMQRLAPLQERQQAEQQQAEAQQQQALAKQHAQEQAMEQQAAVFRANGLNDRIVPVIDKMDPARNAHLYEEKPGHWAKIEFDEPEPIAETEAPSNAL